MRLQINDTLETEIIENINIVSKLLDKDVVLMEVCGTHTMSIFRHGIKGILPKNIKLISGPGCPVCVTPLQYIDQAIQLAEKEEVIICTFGDMIRVPGTKGSLENARANGASIKIVYSPLDCINIAKQNLHKQIIFLAVGFETTSPVIGLTIKRAEMEAIQNFSILSCLKQLFPALHALFDSGEVNVDGLICPGHISAITGEEPYGFIPEKYKIPCVIAGFNSSEILMSIYMLVFQVLNGKAKVENAYRKAGTVRGNDKAIALIKDVFQNTDDSWRGLGLIAGSGLKLSETYRKRDAGEFFGLERPQWIGDGACKCGEVIKGLRIPTDCPLFRKICTPRNPVGACMVSSEGSCSAYYKYG